jgi:hypothetical protein
VSGPIWDEYKYRSMAVEFGPNLLEGGPMPGLSSEQVGKLRSEMDARGDLAWATAGELFDSLDRQARR